ncbi:hypothetical protein NOJ28_29565, partial [Neorhizobium galegae]
PRNQTNQTYPNKAPSWGSLRFWPRRGFTSLGVVASSQRVSSFPVRFAVRFEFRSGGAFSSFPSKDGSVEALNRQWPEWRVGALGRPAKRVARMSLLLRKSMKLLAPAAVLQMTIAAIVFGVITYNYQGDFLNSFLYTSICFLLMQAGYLAGIFYAAWSEYRRKSS